MPVRRSQAVVLAFTGLLLASGATAWWIGVNRVDPAAPPAAASGPAYRLRVIDPVRGQVDVDARTTLSPRVVVLVHGLDDPGWTWNALIGALLAEGHMVVRFDYPNDGPLATAAELLWDALGRVRAQGASNVDLVAHSMGGLISRDVLTRRAYYGCEGSGTATRPAIDQVIMLGTPNHGSQMARLRGVSELAEQVSRGWEGAPDLFGFLSDGMGEAGRDLLPDSTYLSELNRRPLPRHTRISIIAGRLSPASEEDVAGWVSEARSVLGGDHAPLWLQRLVDAPELDTASGVLAELVGGVGDGCVSLESAHLEGVTEVTIIEADHVGMIANIIPGDRVPPAVPLVLERLPKPTDADQP